MLLLCCCTETPEMFVFSGEILFMPTNTCVDVFGGLWGGFHLSSTDVVPAEDPTVFPRLLETSEEEHLEEGMLSTEEQTSEKEPLSSQSKTPRSCRRDEMLIFTYRVRESRARAVRFSPSEVERHRPFNDSSPCSHPGRLALDCFCCCLCIRNAKTRSTCCNDSFCPSVSGLCELHCANVCRLSFQVAHVTPVTFVC